MNAALRTTGLTRAFGSLFANSNISLTIEAGARHALIGPNGAGKTTLINLLSGYLKPTSGKIYLAEQEVTSESQHARVKLGMTRTFQISSLFAGLTVLESVVMATLEHANRGNAWWRPVASEGAAIGEAREILARLHLDRDEDTPTSILPYGKRRLLEIALALATRPKLLLLDEPAAGIPSSESADLLGVISDLPRDVSIVFIEHDMSLVFRFAERITVMVGGSVFAEGSPSEISADPRVREVYLGESVDA